jgi:microbial collagenase
VLIPKPQSVRVSSSLKRAPINQGIDFSSAGSEGQIVNYRWDFGDGFVSTEANPTHLFSTP